MKKLSLTLLAVSALFIGTASVSNADDVQFINVKMVVETLPGKSWRGETTFLRKASFDEFLNDQVKSSYEELKYYGCKDEFDHHMKLMKGKDEVTVFHDEDSWQNAKGILVEAGKQSTEFTIMAKAKDCKGHQGK